MLWDLIRDFFVQNIFGGLDSEGFYHSFNIGSGSIYDGENWTSEILTNEGLVYQVQNSADGLPYYLTLGDWLSTTASVISITIIVVLCCMFIYKIVRLIGGLIR